MPETITEERVELMVSPTGDRTPTHRPAHFLNPSSIDGARSEIPSCSPLSSLPPTFHPKEWPLQVKFICWRRTPKKWVQWVNSLHSTYETHWKKLGIYESIMSSKHEIYKSDELLLGIAEKWSPTSNTFVFPWGEATITLEDILVLGGYPVLGDSVLSPLENEQLKEIETKLIKATKEALKTRSNKVSIMEWIELFFDKGRELEHEAFLSAWLSVFVFPNNYFVHNAVFPIAIHLARGNKIALAPAVLASIYRDLDMLKESIVALPKFQAEDDEEYLPLDLNSPFWLVQIWVWERIQSMQPKPNVIYHGDPLLAKWQKVKPLNVRNVRLALDSAGDGFNWRPYAILKHHSHMFYPENEMWVTLEETNFDEKLKSFIICFRFSELVGLDCIRQYLPHRVAMQFGFDQDVPGRVPRFNQSHGIACDNYGRTMSYGKLYIPPRLFEADITTRYLDWWKISVMSHKDPFKDFVKGQRTPRVRKLVPQASEGNIAAHNGHNVPSGFPPEQSNMEILGYSWENDDACVSPGTVPKRMKLVNDVYKAEEALRAKAANVPVPYPEVPPGFPPRHNSGDPGNSVGESEPATFRENVETSMVGLEQAREGGNGSKEPCLANERAGIEGEERTNEPERKKI